MVVGTPPRVTGSPSTGTLANAPPRRAHEDEPPPIEIGTPTFGSVANEPPAQLTVAQELKVVQVAAPDVNCVFNTTCRIFVNDSSGNISVPGVSGPSFLQTRTYLGEGEAPAGGMFGYEYRATFYGTENRGGRGCVDALTVDFGPIERFDYDGDGSLDDVFVVTRGGMGSISVASAVQLGSSITFTFERPVCSPESGNGGETTYFFGLTSAASPMPSTGQLDMGGQLVDIPVRVPTP